MKKALVVCYSQIGQTRRAVDQLCAGLGGYDLDFIDIQPQPPFAFPWKVTPFFRIFPQCVMNQGTPISPLALEDPSDGYDLIILAYQVWFLSASLPIQAVLKDRGFQELVRGRPVLCLVTSRNMWVSAVEKVNGSLKVLGASFVKTQVLCDLAPAWATFVTTPRWMLTGKKGPFWFFPEAGIRSKDFELPRALGEKISIDGIEAVHTIPFSHRQSFACVLMEKMGYPVFVFWSKCIALLAPNQNLFRDFMLILFRLSLVATILVLLPVTALIQLLASPLFAKSMNGYIDNLLQD